MASIAGRSSSDGAATATPTTRASDDASRAPTTRPAWVPPVADGRTIAAGSIPAARAWPIASRPRGPGPPRRPARSRRRRRRTAASRLAAGPAATRWTSASRSVRWSVVGDVDRRPEHRVEALVRAGLVERRAAQDEVDVEARPGAGGGRQPAVVRPAPARRHQRVGALGERRPDEELEVAQLVPAERQRQEVLALDPDLDPAAERRREPRQRAGAATGPSSSGKRGSAAIPGGTSCASIAAS